MKKFDFKLSPREPFSILSTDADQGASKPTPLDIHKAIHFGILQKGNLTGITRNQIHRTNEGDFYIVAPWEPHGIVRRTATRILLLNIAEEELMRCFISGGNNLRNLLLTNPPQRMKYLNSPRLRPLLRQFASDFIALMAKNDDWTKSRQWNTICRMFIELDSMLENPGTPIQPHRLNKALELLYQSNGKIVSLADAAAVCELGTSRFSHLFKEYFGVSFGSYELQYRLNCAAESLLYQNLPLKETAERWGFYDAAHFSRYFKKYFGMTPGQYLRPPVIDPSQHM